jgi:hypothetical protein
LFQISSSPLPSSLPSDLKDQLLLHQPLDPDIAETISMLKDPERAQDAPKHYSLDPDGILLHKGLTYVPDFDNLKIQLLRQAHDSPVAGHFGQNKTLELLSRDFYWPNMRILVNEYVGTCDTCHRAKPTRHRKYGLLQPLPIPSRPWSSISMDHIVELPISNGFNAILVIVDRFTKMAHFIPALTTDKSSDLAQRFIDNIFRLHGLPADIVSDRGVTFTSKWWQDIERILRIKPNLSTAFHPESDGQTERVNQVVEQYLRIHCDYLQDDWSSLLSVAEFAYNNAHHSSIGMSPFFANNAQHPRIDITLHESQVPAARAFVLRIENIHERASAALKRAQESYTRFADRKRLEPPPFQIGDRVWLLRRYIKTTQPSPKLDSKRLGPFPITAAIGTRAFRLALPPTMKIHPVFHVSLLEPYNPNTLPNRTQPVPPPPEVLNEDDTYDWEVDKILDSRFYYRRLQYYVDWKGLPPEERQWVEATDFHRDDDVVLEYHAAYPDRPSYENQQTRAPARKPARQATRKSTRTKRSKRSRGAQA